MKYTTGNNCPECGTAEGWVHRQWHEEGYGMHHEFTYSCQHFEQRLKDSPCKYCGKKNTPVRQVPCPIPVSECYCDDCREKCRQDYANVGRGT